MTVPEDILKALGRASSHLRDEDYALYVDGALSAERRKWVEAHLERCPECRLSMAQIHDAVAADIADSAHLDAAIARITGEGQSRTPAALRDQGTADIHYIRPGEGGSGAPAGRYASPLSDEVATVLRRLGRGAADLIELSFVSLTTWTRQTPVADVPLAVNRPAYTGLQSPLESLFPAGLLDTDLAWASGPLLLRAAYDEAGNIRSVWAAVGTRGDNAAGIPIVLEISDEAARTAALALTPARPSDVRQRPPIKGQLERLGLKLLIVRPE